MHQADPWASNGAGAGAALQSAPYGYGGQMATAPPIMSNNPVGPNAHMAQPPYPGQGIFS